MDGVPGIFTISLTAPGAVRIDVSLIKTGDPHNIGTQIFKLFEGMRFDRQKLEPVLRDGIKAGTYQLRLNHKRLGKDWQKVLEEVIKNIT